VPSRPAPRQRLVETAARLFYERGLPNIGINEVTDRAGVARMTLYNNFASKEVLALAAFEHQAEARRRMIDAHLGKAATPAAGVAALFDVAEVLAAQPRFKGCAFINVALQVADPGGRLHALALDHKLWVRGKFQGLAELARARLPQRLAQQLLALWDGAIVEAYIQGSVEPIEAARQAAKVLLAAAADPNR
jgi:AcrR family transcriptional regulator